MVTVTYIKIYLSKTSISPSMFGRCSFTFKWNNIKSPSICAMADSVLPRQIWTVGKGRAGKVNTLGTKHGLEMPLPRRCTEFQ